MEKNIVEINFKAPYYKVGTITQNTKNIWLIFHGYGQLVEDFAESFTSINSRENVLIFPQGLSKFYLKGVDHKIGSNWMTSHDRALDIANYLNYIDCLFDHEIKPHLGHIKLNVFGFSQGGHTASRWIHHTKISYSKLVLWGSSLAHEINKEDIKKSFSTGKNITVIGDQDRFIDLDQLEKVKHRYAKIGFAYDLIPYHGSHNIHPETLSQII